MSNFFHNLQIDFIPENNSSKKCILNAGQAPDIVITVDVINEKLGIAISELVVWRPQLNFPSWMAESISV